MSRLVTFRNSFRPTARRPWLTLNPGKSCTGCREHPIFEFQKGGNANES